MLWASVVQYYFLQCIANFIEILSKCCSPFVSILLLPAALSPELPPDLLHLQQSLTPYPSLFTNLFTLCLLPASVIFNNFFVRSFCLLFSNVSCSSFSLFPSWLMLYYRYVCCLSDVFFYFLLFDAVLLLLRYFYFRRPLRKHKSFAFPYNFFWAHSHVTTCVCVCVCVGECVCWSTLFSLHFSFATDSSFLSRKRKSSICTAAADWSCPDTSLPLGVQSIPLTTHMYQRQRQQ